jgi:hypothetical protein
VFHKNTKRFETSQFIRIQICLYYPEDRVYNEKIKLDIKEKKKGKQQKRKYRITNKQIKKQKEMIGITAVEEKKPMGQTNKQVL